MRLTGLKQSSLVRGRAGRTSLYNCLQPHTAIAIALVCVMMLPIRVFGQVSFSRGGGREMLKDIRRDMEENYYDSSFHGKDLDAHFKVLAEMIAKAETTEQVYATVAQASMDCNVMETREQYAADALGGLPSFTVRKDYQHECGNLS